MAEVIEKDGVVYVNGIAMPDYHGTANEDNENEKQLSKHWTVSVTVDSFKFDIYIFAGFKFDGASIPRVLWRLCGHPFTCPREAAALAHDWLYASHAVDRETADKIYRELQKVLGINIISRNVEYWTLRVFGGFAWKSKSTAEIHDANYFGNMDYHFVGTNKKEIEA